MAAHVYYINSLMYKLTHTPTVVQGEGREGVKSREEMYIDKIALDLLCEMKPCLLAMISGYVKKRHFISYLGIAILVSTIFTKFLR